MLFHESETVVHDLIKENGDSDQDHTNDYSENHLVRFSLLDTLLPDIVLHTGLFGTSSITKVDDVLDQPFIDTLKAHCIHIKDCLEGLAHTESRLTDRVFTLIDQV